MIILFFLIGFTYAFTDYYNIFEHDHINIYPNVNICNKSMSTYNLIGRQYGGITTTLSLNSNGKYYSINIPQKEEQIVRFIEFSEESGTSIKGGFCLDGLELVILSDRSKTYSKIVLDMGKIGNIQGTILYNYFDTINNCINLGKYKNKGLVINPNNIKDCGIQDKGCIARTFTELANNPYNPQNKIYDTGRWVDRQKEILLCHQEEQIARCGCDMCKDIHGKQFCNEARKYKDLSPSKLTQFFDGTSGSLMPMYYRTTYYHNGITPRTGGGSEPGKIAAIGTLLQQLWNVYDRFIGTDKMRAYPNCHVTNNEIKIKDIDWEKCIFVTDSSTSIEICKASSGC